MNPSPAADYRSVETANQQGFAALPARFEKRGQDYVLRVWTPDLPRNAPDLVECLAQNEASGYGCTLMEGHEGEHIAHASHDPNDPDYIVDRWPQDLPTQVSSQSDGSEPYFVEVEKKGCEKCGHDRMYTVVGPDGYGSSTTYGDVEEAEYLAEQLNDAYELGRVAGIVQT